MNQPMIDEGVLSQIREASRMAQQIDPQLIEQMGAMCQSNEAAMARIQSAGVREAAKATEREIAAAYHGITTLLDSVNQQQLVTGIEQKTAILNASLSSVYDQFQEAEALTSSVLSTFADSQIAAQIAAAQSIATLNIIDMGGLAGAFRQMELFRNTGLNAMIAYQDAAAPLPQIFNTESAWAAQMATLHTGLSGFYDNVLPSLSGLIQDTVEPFAERCTEWLNMTSGIEQTAAECARAIGSLIDTRDMVSAAALDMSVYIPNHIRTSPLIDMPATREPHWAISPTLPSRVMDWDDEPEPPPSGGVCYQELTLSRGTITQLGNLFRYYLGIDHSPSECFIIRDEHENYWHIYLCKQTDSISREKAVQRDAAAGYVCGIDLPNPHVQFFAYSEKAWEKIAPYLKRIKQTMLETGFKFLAKDENKRGLTAGTEEKLMQLRELRNKNKVNGKVMITRTYACQFVGIDRKTVIANAYELYEKWEDVEL